MGVVSPVVCPLAAGLALLLGACQAPGSAGDGGGTPAGLIGAAGGTLTSPSGARLVVPAGALAVDTPLAIEVSAAGAPPLPVGLTPLGAMVAFTPHGTTFARPATLVLPFDPAGVPAGQVPVLFKTNARQQWEQLPAAAFGAAEVSAEVGGLSWVQVGGLLRSDPLRSWRFGVLRGDALEELPQDGGTLAEGPLDEIAVFGPTREDLPVVRLDETLPPDDTANGQVLSTADGVTFQVLAEAPSGLPRTPAPVGGVATLKQTQSFIKLVEGATFRFTLTSVVLRLLDFDRPRTDHGAPLEATVMLSVGAYQDPSEYFFYTGGQAWLFGEAGSFRRVASDFSFSRSFLWDAEAFELRLGEAVQDNGVTSCLGEQAQLVLKQPHTYTVDLSAVGVGEEFTVRIDTFARARNAKGGGAAADCQDAAAAAYLRDPSEVGGATLQLSGLAPTNRPLEPAPPVGGVEPPAACDAGPGPLAAAGLLEFSAASYRAEESGTSAPVVAVSRTGGSAGEVTAIVTTRDGTAIAGRDFAPVATTVFFADGDLGPRLVPVPVLDDAEDEVDEMLELTLSRPGGCGALGARTEAVLTIGDDDARPATPAGLDPTFGAGGKATTTGFGGDRSALALQADGKLVMVGGTFADFVLARFDAQGALDPGFGVGGLVSTDVGGAFIQEEALAVAVQPDGRIVVAGYSSLPRVPPAPAPPPSFALVRYLPDGRLDPSFGTGGVVLGTVTGLAAAVGIQADGKVVVAGELPRAPGAGGDTGDVVVARFTADGRLDPSFGTAGSGQVVTDLGGAPNSARNLVLQPDGAIVVSGRPLGSAPGLDHTDLVRYRPDGSLDPGFGTLGRLTLAGFQVAWPSSRTGSWCWPAARRWGPLPPPPASPWPASSPTAAWTPASAWGDGWTRPSP